MQTLKLSINSPVHGKKVVVVSGSALFVGTRAILLALLSYWSAMALALPPSAVYLRAQSIRQKPKGQLHFPHIR